MSLPRFANVVIMIGVSVAVVSAAMAINRLRTRELNRIEPELRELIELTKESPSIVGARFIPRIRETHRQYIRGFVLTTLSHLSQDLLAAMILIMTGTKLVSGLKTTLSGFLESDGTASIIVSAIPSEADLITIFTAAGLIIRNLINLLKPLERANRNHNASVKMLQHLWGYCEQTGEYEGLESGDRFKLLSKNMDSLITRAELVLLEATEEREEPQ